MKYFSLICLFLTSIIILNGCSKKIPISKTYEKNGVLLEYYVDKPVTGLVEDGQNLKNYKDGILDGESKIIQSEDKKAVLNYKAGLLNGKASYYYKGNLTFEGDYRNGLLNGSVTAYTYDGKIKIFEGTFRKGKAVGKILVHDGAGNIITQFDIDSTKDLMKVKYYSPSENLHLASYGIKNLNSWEEFYYLNDPIITPIKIMMNDSKYNFTDIYNNSPQMLSNSGSTMELFAFMTIENSFFNHSVSLKPASFSLHENKSPLNYSFSSQSDIEINRIQSDIKKIFADSSYSITAGPKVTLDRYNGKYGFECPLIVSESLWENKNKDMFTVRETKFDTQNDLYMGTTFEIFHVGFLQKQK
jgi:antitoxin component YwqK of YwqJK toxin-antitoxin module